MPEPIDLSTLRNGLTAEQQQALNEMAEKTKENDAPKARTAFLVVVDENGGVHAVPDLDVKIDRKYVPNADDVTGALAVLQRDMTAQIAAQHVLVGMQQVAAQQMQQLQNAQLAQKLGLKK